MTTRPLLLLLLASTALFVAACSSADDAPAAAPSTAESPADPVSSGDPAAPAPAPPRTVPANGSKGCGAAGIAPGGGQARSIDAKGEKRSYLLSIPAGYDTFTAYPVVFVFHSGGGTGAKARDYFKFQNIAEDKAIFVYPDGKRGEWDLDTPTKDNADVAFFDALLADLKARTCMDETRVFATGSSMGAYFSNQLGCRRGDALRAIAPHAGGGPFDVDSAYDEDGHLKCEGKPVAAMVFHGDNDTNVSVEDGQLSVDHWAWANGCKKTTKPIAPSPCVAYDGCAKPVVWCKVPGIGHRVWSEGPKASWDFFASL
jgi:polyhydroxybutyrate depolymerase